MHAAATPLPTVEIRPEHTGSQADTGAGARGEDATQIHAVHAACFPTDGEARLVDALRAAGHLSHSWVAGVGDRVVGHAGFSPVTRVDGPALVGAAGQGLAPLAVLAEHRGQGLAERLVRAGLGASARAGVPFVVVLGEPGFYARFGFRPARQWGLVDEYGGGDHFMALELQPGGLGEGTQPRPVTVRYAPAFALL